MSEEFKNKQVKSIKDAFRLTEDGKVVIDDEGLAEAVRYAESPQGQEEGCCPIPIPIPVKA
jgi:hypothetical protein